MIKYLKNIENVVIKFDVIRRTRIHAVKYDPSLLETQEGSHSTEVLLLKKKSSSQFLSSSVKRVYNIDENNVACPSKIRRMSRSLRQPNSGFCSFRPPSKNNTLVFYCFLATEQAEYFQALDMTWYTIFPNFNQKNNKFTFWNLLLSW